MLSVYYNNSKVIHISIIFFLKKGNDSVISILIN